MIILHLCKICIYYSWEKTYALEIENFKDHGDTGEIWFGSENASKVIRYVVKIFKLNLIKVLLLLKHLINLIFF